MVDVHDDATVSGSVAPAPAPARKAANAQAGEQEDCTPAECDGSSGSIG